MTRDDFLENYIAAFNRRDFDSFTCFYDDAVVLYLGQKAILRGKPAIQGFYTEVFKRIKETLKVERLVLDDTTLACIVSTEFHALADWPDFLAGAIRKGESIFIESFIFYTIGVNGKFTEIRTARSKG